MNNDEAPFADISDRFGFLQGGTTEIR